MAINEKIQQRVAQKCNDRKKEQFIKEMLLQMQENKQTKKVIEKHLSDIGNEQ